MGGSNSKDREYQLQKKLLEYKSKMKEQRIEYKKHLSKLTENDKKYIAEQKGIYEDKLNDSKESIPKLIKEREKCDRIVDELKKDLEDYSTDCSQEVEQYKQKHKYSILKDGLEKADELIKAGINQTSVSEGIVCTFFTFGPYFNKSNFS